MRSSSNSLKGRRHNLLIISGVPVIDDVSLPDLWIKQVACADMIKGNFKDPNPWGYTVRERRALTGVQYVDVPSVNVSQQWDGTLSDGMDTGCISFATSGPLERTYEGALSRLNEKLRGSLDLATSLAETKQTVKMLNLVERFEALVTDMSRSYGKMYADNIRAFRSRRGAAKALRRWQKGIKSRHSSSYQPVPVTPGLTARSTSLAANGWCEFTYGLSPLIGDIRGVAENIVGFVRNNNGARVSFTERQDSSPAGPVVNLLGVEIPQSKVRVKQTGFVKTIIGVKLESGWDVSLARWSSLNPLSVAWELIPYSFVVDWVYNIGDYLRNLESSVLYSNSFVSGYVSSLVKVDMVSNIDHGGVDGARHQYTKCTGSESYTQFSRSILLHYPAPHLPSFKLDLGASQLISAAALLRQLLK